MFKWGSNSIRLNIAATAHSIKAAPTWVFLEDNCKKLYVSGEESTIEPNAQSTIHTMRLRVATIFIHPLLDSLLGEIVMEVFLKCFQMKV